MPYMAILAFIVLGIVWRLSPWAESKDSILKGVSIAEIARVSTQLSPHTLCIRLLSGPKEWVSAGLP